MPVNLLHNKLVKKAGTTGEFAYRWIRFQQSGSAVGEPWIFRAGIFGSVVGYQTRLDSANPAPLYLRPELGSALGFVFGSAAGTGIARLRRAVLAVNTASGAPLILPLGKLHGRSGLSRNLDANETLTTDIFIAETDSDAQRGPEQNGDWEVGNLSTQAILVGTVTPLPSGAASAFATDGVLTDGAVDVELWLDFVAGAGATPPADVRVRFDVRREPGVGQWAPVLWEDNNDVTPAGGVAPVPSYAYEIVDTLENLGSPPTLPFSRHYVIPARNWSGEVRATLYTSGQAADGVEVEARFILRGG